ncbi:MAG: methionyl-tRNA formyltransferase [Patescibacteria group bacterium]
MTRVIFFGTPNYVLPVPKALKSAGFDLVATVTQPPKPVGRKQILTPSSVAIWSKENNILNIDGEPEEIIAPLKELGAEVGVLAAYGRILPGELLSLFPKGIVNIHPSLLPRWRGPAPVEAIILSSDTPGITFIKLDEEMDHGPILKQTEETLDENATKDGAINYLFKKAAGYLPNLLVNYLSGKTQTTEQKHNKATFTKLLKKQDGFIPSKILELASQVYDPERSRRDDLPIRWMRKSIKKGDVFSFEPTPQFLERFIRALSPWPGAWTNIQLVTSHELRVTKRLKILKAHVEEEKLTLDQVQLEGKSPVEWNQFKRSQPRLEF